jgi:hypothetical protein
MKSALVCIGLLLVTATSAGALETKKKVVSVVDAVCDSSSAKAKKFDCKPTGTVAAAKKSSQTNPPTLETEPRLGYVGNPWIISGF